MEMEHLIKLIEAVSHSGLSRFEYEESGVKIHMEKPETVQVSSVQVQTEVSEQIQEAAEDQVITCPLVGIFYAAPEEGAEAFVSVGDSVKKGQTLAIVEAMKLMNEIESDFDGVVKQILVSNEDVIEFGQPLFVIS